MPAMKNLPIVLLVGIACFSLAGCSRPPAVQHDHLPLISSLRTACSARNTTWLAGVKRAVAERQTAGKMSVDERAHFDKLIAQAEAGEWETAERACLKFEQAQLSRKRPAAETAGHSHDHSHAD
ncbi:hypothetical protein NA78x_000615 [Anatilimnocola sp. NA78]|uniref:hypothetical protein n=1 Tax=Anatilimnocola sp. NA78 TaxID=3415683 RepID=UPI003CE5B254